VPTTELVQRPSGNLGHELGREPMDTVSVAGSVVRKAEREELAVLDIIKTR